MGIVTRKGKGRPLTWDELDANFEEIPKVAANVSRLTLGAVQTGDAGSQASLEITGDPGAQVLNLVVPRGDKGDTGEKGERGESANSSLVTNFVDTPIGQVFFVKTPDRTGTVIEYADAGGVVRWKKYELTGKVYQNTAAPNNVFFPNGSPIMIGGREVESVYIGESCYADATRSTVGVDRVYLPFSYADYPVKALSGYDSLLTIKTTSPSGLKHGALVATGSSATSCDIVSFSDGGCTTYDMKLALLAGTVPVLDPALATPASVPADAIEISFVQHNNWLRCYGQTVNTADYPLLAKAWGITASTFTIPAIENSDISIANPINPDLMAFVVAA